MYSSLIYICIFALNDTMHSVTAISFSIHSGLAGAVLYFKVGIYIRSSSTF